MIKVLRALVGLAVVGMSMLPFAQSAKAIDSMTIDPSYKIIVGGTGCPANSAKGIINGNSVAIIFDKWQVRAPAGASASAGCNVRIGLIIPEGYTVQPFHIGYLGSTGYTPGGSALVETNMAWAGRVYPLDAFRVESVKGPKHTGGWDRNIDVNLAAINACKSKKQGVLGVNTLLTADARLAGKGNEVRLGMETMDLNLEEEAIYQVKFKYHSCK